ncbi:MAG: response regulator [Spirochaetaceae bacterium]|nr:MAG: response regulator [Spirochaetaceae bacterium]
MLINENVLHMIEENKNYSVLIVDDSPENIDILHEILKNKFRVKAAVNGNQALHVVGLDDKPDIILLDVMMPDLSGFDVCTKLKSDEKTRDIPVIFLTVSASADDIVKGFESGGVDYITKPFNAVELLSRVNTHLQLKIATDSMKSQNVTLEKMVSARTELLQENIQLLHNTVQEKDALLEKVRQMEKRLRKSLKIANRLYGKVQSIQEDERKKISMDLHDELGQSLTAIKLKLFQLKNQLETNTELNDKIGSILVMADDTIKATQRISRQLRPDILDNLGFYEAVKSYCRTIDESSGMHIDLVIQADPPTLAPETELCLYRVIQEAVTNIIRHSNAKKADIHITHEGNALRVTIRDYGAGIDRQMINNSASLGIFGMKKRIHAIHGGFRIRGAAGKGTKISILIPFSRKQND